MTTNNGAPRPTWPAGSVYGDGIPRHVRTVYGDPVYLRRAPYMPSGLHLVYGNPEPGDTPLMDTIGPFVGHDAYGVPVPPVNGTHAPDDRAVTDWKIGGAL